MIGLARTGVGSGTFAMRPIVPQREAPCQSPGDGSGVVTSTTSAAERGDEIGRGEMEVDPVRTAADGDDRIDPSPTRRR